MQKMKTITTFGTGSKRRDKKEGKLKDILHDTLVF